MKAVICDLCGKQVDEQSFWERYIFWKYEPIYGEKPLERIDICHDCKEQLVDIIKQRRQANGNSNDLPQRVRGKAKRRRNADAEADNQAE